MDPMRRIEETTLSRWAGRPVPSCRSGLPGMIRRHHGSCSSRRQRRAAGCWLANDLATCRGIGVNKSVRQLFSITCAGRGDQHVHRPHFGQPWSPRPLRPDLVVCKTLSENRTRARVQVAPGRYDHRRDWPGTSADGRRFDDETEGTGGGSSNRGRRALECAGGWRTSMSGETSWRRLRPNWKRVHGRFYIRRPVDDVQSVTV